jgi:hypothetical protein
MDLTFRFKPAPILPPISYNWHVKFVCTEITSPFEIDAKAIGISVPLLECVFVHLLCSTLLHPARTEARVRCACCFA